MQEAKTIETNAQACGAPTARSGWLNSRNVLIGAAVLGGGAALFFGWDSLVAAGLASVIVGVLPCLAMCAAGLCMGRRGGNQAAPPPTSPLPPEQAGGASSTPPSSSRT